MESTVSVSLFYLKQLNLSKQEKIAHIVIKNKVNNNILKLTKTVLEHSHVIKIYFREGEYFLYR